MALPLVVVVVVVVAVLVVVRPHPHCRSLTHRGRLIMSPASRSTPGSTIYPFLSPPRTPHHRMCGCGRRPGCWGWPRHICRRQNEPRLAGHPRVHPRTPSCRQPLRPWVKQRENDSRRRLDIAATKFCAEPHRAHCPGWAIVSFPGERNEYWSF